MNFATTHTAGGVPAIRTVSADATSAICGTSPQDAVGRQLSIEDAIAAGERYAALALDAAQRAEPTFTQRACEAILAHLRVVKQASGEDLVLLCGALGIIPANGDRAFGGVFRSLSCAKLIYCVRSDLPRTRGHGTSGGKLWAIQQS